MRKIGLFGVDSPLYDFIKNQDEINLIYLPFGNIKPTKSVFQPYLLKEYNNRWFVIGWSPNEKWQTIYGLSRILSMEKTGNAFIRNENFSSPYYFSDILGISVELESKQTEKIILSFSPKRGQYILTKPIHHSQKTLTNNKIEVKIQLMLKINRELITEILSFGADVKIIEPESLKQRIIYKYRDVLNLY